MTRQSLALFIALSLGAACGSDDDPVGPSGNGNSGLTYSVDGSTVSGVTTANFDGTAFLIGAANASLQSISVSWVDGGTGTFPVGPNSETIGVYGNGLNAWSAYKTLGSGSVTVTSRTGSRIKGTFQFVMGTSTGGSATKTISNGSFDLVY